MNNADSQLLPVVIWALFFLALNLTLRWKLPIPGNITNKTTTKSQDHIRWEYTALYGTLVFSTMINIICFYLWQLNGICYIRQNIVGEEHLLAFALGYYITDGILGVIYKFNDSLINFHHVQCFLIILYALVKGKYASVLIWGLFIAEISNPFLIAMKILSNFKGLKLYETISGIAFSVVFLITRTYFVWSGAYPLFESQATLAIKINFAVIWYLSLIWCYMIINMLLKEILALTGNWTIQCCYQALKSVRTNIRVKTSLYTIFGLATFGKVLINWTHESII